MIEYKEEINAVGRCKSGKIKGKEKYAGQIAGKLRLSVTYSREILTVVVKSANSLYGRRSQDPYALCYLHERGEVNSWFEAGNEKTPTLEKTLDPVWDTTFRFKMTLSDLVRKSLIVSIWDEDSDSKDDYMAGIRIDLQDVQYFDASKGVVEVTLQPQDPTDGHPLEPPEQLWWRGFFGYLAWMEYKEEYNACGRADRRKIHGPDHYKNGQSPGSLNISLNYSADGILNVFVDSAKNLYGKRSQDPYALCYLHERGERKSWFQVGNNKTNTMDKTLEPVWKHTFQLKMNMTELSRKSLVIAIWDQDSTTRDDYMAGIRINLRDIHQFDFRKGLITVQLMAQDATDGHPLETNIHYWRGLDLKTCNNHLVAFIERARVLAEAIEVKKMYPDMLNNLSEVKFDAIKMMKDEIIQMRRKFEERRKYLVERMELKRNLSETKHGYERTYEQCRVTIQTLCSTSCGLRTDQTHLLIAVNRKDDIETKWNVSLNLGESSQYQQWLERRIRIITEYEHKMKMRLSEVRMTYSEKYQSFIISLRTDTDKIMSLYEELIQLKIAKNPGYRDGLLELETRRNYRFRIDTLSTDINSINEALRILQEKLARMEGDWMSQIRPLDDGLAAMKAQLREMLLKMVAYAESRYTVTNEVAIYEKLLGFEDKRLIAFAERVLKSVRVRQSRESVSGTVLESRNSLPRRPDSGIFSPSP